MREDGSDGTIRERLLTVCVIGKSSVRSFAQNRGFESAATIAFYGVFALIPLFMAVLYLLSSVFVSSRAVSRAVEHLIIQIVPQFYEVILREVFSLAEKRTLGVLGTLALLWSIVPLVSSIRSGFIRVFKTERTSGYIRNKLTDFATVLLVLLLFIGLVASEVLYLSVLDGYLAQSGTNLDFVNLAVPLAAAVLFLSVFFVVFSPVRLEWWNVACGAVLTAVLWSVVRPLFVLFLHYNPDYGVTFGSLKAVFILVIWVYYSFAVILFGAEVLANTRRREALMLSRLFSLERPDPADAGLIPARFLRDYETGEVIFEEGSPGREMFYILSGAVRIVKQGHLLREMGPGNYFGEMALLIQVPRTASAVAAAPGTRLAAVSEGNLETLLRENPGLVRSFLKEMSSRLRLTNDTMGAPPAACRDGEGGTDESTVGGPERKDAAARNRNEQGGETIS